MKKKGLLYIGPIALWGYLTIHYWVLLLENNYMWNEIGLSNNLRMAYMVVETWMLFCAMMLTLILLRMIKGGD